MHSPSLASLGPFLEVFGRRTFHGLVRCMLPCLEVPSLHIRTVSRFRSRLVQGTHTEYCDPRLVLRTRTVPGNAED